MKKHLIKILNLVIFILFYLKEIVKANIILAKDILSPRMNICPAIVKIKIDVKNENSILALFNLVTMTPGSLCMDISDDRKSIYVHGMYVKDRDSFELEIKEGIEKKVKEVFE